MEPMVILCLMCLFLETPLTSTKLTGVTNLDRGSAHPAFEHAAGWSFTPDVSGMAYEERRSYLDSIAQGPGGHEERK